MPENRQMLAQGSQFEQGSGSGVGEVLYGPWWVDMSDIPESMDINDLDEETCA